MSTSKGLSTDRSGDSRSHHWRIVVDGNVAYHLTITPVNPKKISRKWAMVVFPIVCAVHGFLYGTLYAPFQALAFGMDFKQTITWIISGIPWDIVHGVSNFLLGFFVWPISQAIIKAHKHIYK